MKGYIEMKIVFCIAGVGVGIFFGIVMYLFLHITWDVLSYAVGGLFGLESDIGSDGGVPPLLIRILGGIIIIITGILGGAIGWDAGSNPRDFFNSISNDGK